MNTLQLCDMIHLQPEMKRKTAGFLDQFDMTEAADLLEKFWDYDKMGDACIELVRRLGHDPGHVKILVCMLYASAKAYKIYQEKNIDDEIYTATMKCYTRFLDETYAETGQYEFDRFWWTTRQAGCHLFRIGELEYEIVPQEGRKAIHIHIPSDAVFTPDAVDESLRKADAFFKAYDPELSGSEYFCTSWLLEPRLKDMLSEGSNILSFQNRFQILKEGEPGTSFLKWVFKTGTDDYTTLPEETSLQRKMKEYILSGGVIRDTCGKLAPVDKGQSGR